MKAIILFLTALCCLNAQDCKHIKPAEVIYLGVQTSEFINTDSISCIIYNRQAERFTCPVCKAEVSQESRKDTVILYKKEGFNENSD